MANSSLVNIDLTKPVTVLIEKIASAAGIVYEPTRIRRKARAESDAEIISAKANIEVSAIENRAIKRLIKEETRKQKNIESIIEKTLPNLDADSKPEEVEDDWLAHFFERSKNIGNGDIQNIWGQILAGEANMPGSYSKRTINLLSEFEQNDAKIFSELSNFVLNIADRKIPMITDYDNELYTNRGISFNSLNHLESLGLIHFNTLGQYSLTPKTKLKIIIKYFDSEYTADINAGHQFGTGTVQFTQQGLELFQICKPTKVQGLDEIVISYYKNAGLNFSNKDI